MRGFIYSYAEENKGTPEQAAEAWMELQAEINAPGYYDKGGEYEKWYNSHADEWLQNATQQDHASRNGKRQYEAKRTLDALLLNEYPAYFDCTLKNWVQKTTAHSKIINSVWDIAKLSDLQIWHGKTGTGKTHLLIGLIKALCDRGLESYVFKWQYINDLFSSVRTKNKHGIENTPSNHIRDLDKYDLLCIDDYNTGGYAKSNPSKHLFELIDTRKSKNKKTILVSNDPLELILQSFGNFRNLIERRLRESGNKISLEMIEGWKK